MDYWQILVLAAVRLGCNLDYDKLQDLAEQHRALRRIMGIGDWGQQTTFDWRRIRDNVTLIRPETIQQISQLIGAEGHQLVPEAPQTVRADSFVVQTNIHYPTESTLIRDGLRKVLGLCVTLAALLGVGGWRQHKHLYKKAKVLARQIDRIAARKGAGYQQRLRRPYRELLDLAETITGRAEKLVSRSSSGAKCWSLKMAPVSSVTLTCCRAMLTIGMWWSNKRGPCKSVWEDASAKPPSTAVFIRRKTNASWPRSLPTLVCPCPGAIRHKNKHGRRALSSVKRGSGIRASNRQSARCRQATG